ncbi:hypothetical protein LIER_00288 [Lithospermum erythrorhizon]|uniref:Uncharacterized protein n=1 Tax=Lithospermum erythrorhizon TaxID=34254 RepID=A0AAV3NID9_LITER
MTTRARYYTGFGTSVSLAPLVSREKSFFYTDVSYSLDQARRDQLTVDYPGFELVIVGYIGIIISQGLLRPNAPPPHRQPPMLKL